MGATYGLVATAEWVQFNVTSIWGGDAAGISEIRFIGTPLPEPTTVVLLGLGAIGLLLAARQRRGSVPKSAVRFHTFLGAAVVVALVGASSASANPIYDPVSAVASSEFPGRPAVSTIDGSGLISASPWDMHQSADPNLGQSPDTFWLSNGEVTPTITWDLGAVYSLSGFHLWNYNEGQNGAYPAGKERGMQITDVQVSTVSAAGPYTDLGHMTFAEATGFDTYTAATYALNTTAEWVRFTAITNWGDSSLTGLSEIRFIGTPEPTSVVLLVLGAVGPLLVARRLR